MRYVQALLMAALVVYPTLTLPLKKANSLFFYLLFLLGMAALFIRFRSPSHINNRSVTQCWLLNLAMGSMLIAVLVHQLATGDFKIRSYDVPFHLACFGIFFQLFLLLESRQLKVVQWGVVGGVLTSLVAIFIVTDGGNLRPVKILDTAIIPFSNHATLLGFLALLSIKWNESKSKIVALLKVLIFCAGLSITILSQTRGGWLTLLLYMIIGSMVFLRRDWKRIAALFLIFVGFLMSAATFSENVKNRIEAAQSDIGNYMNGTNPDTSVGLRIQFWKASLLIIKEHWVVGIGDENFKKEMQELSAKEIITPFAATFPHPHNELMNQTVRYGVLGLLSIFCILFIPFAIFVKYLRHSNEEIRVAAWMGIAVCLGFFTFGLTDVVLVWRYTVTFYIFFLAVLFAFIFKRNQELECISQAKNEYHMLNMTS